VGKRRWAMKQREGKGEYGGEGGRERTIKEVEDKVREGNRKWGRREKRMGKRRRGRN